jgi:anaerobic selenocysteine-containing dehydrogenase
MTDTITSRRDFMRIAAAGAAAVSAVAVSTTVAEAYQGNMERALSSLYEALGSLREATPNKGGHRETAIQLVQQAISETQAGIDYADQNGGG